MVKALLTFCKAFNALVNHYNDSRNHNNNSLEHIDLSENGKSVANVLQSVPRFNESYNDPRIVITIPKNVVFKLDH
jgi:hypothetical protein